MDIFPFLREWKVSGCCQRETNLDPVDSIPFSAWVRLFEIMKCFPLATNQVVFFSITTSFFKMHLIPSLYCLPWLPLFIGKVRVTSSFLRAWWEMTGSALPHLLMMQKQQFLILNIFDFVRVQTLFKSGWDMALLDVTGYVKDLGLYLAKRVSDGITSSILLDLETCVLTPPWRVYESPMLLSGPGFDGRLATRIFRLLM